MLEGANPVPTTTGELQLLVTTAINQTNAVAIVVASAQTAETTQAELNATGITQTALSEDELLSVNEALDTAETNGTSPSTPSELQTLVDTAVATATTQTSKVVIAVNAAPSTTEQLLVDAGVNDTGLSVDELVAINEAIEASDPKPTTTTELQALVTTAVATAADENSKVSIAIADLPNTTEQQLIDAGVNDKNLTAEELVAINKLLEGANPVPTTTGELQELVTQAIESSNAATELLETIGSAAQNESNITGGILDATNLNNIRNVNNAIDENAEAYAQYVVNNPTLFSTPATPTEVQAMVDAVNANVEGMRAVLEDIRGNEDNTPATVAEINGIIGISGARDDVDYLTVLQNGTYADTLNPTAEEIQAVITAENANIDGLNEVVEDILGNENQIAVTATQINAIVGVSGAREGVNYTSALENATYADPEYPTATELQVVIDAKNSEVDTNAARADSESGATLEEPVAVNVLENDNLERLDANSIQIEGTENPSESLVVEGEGTWAIEDGKIVFTPEKGFVFDPTPIKYSLETAEGERLATAEVEVNYEGLVRDDLEITSDLTAPIVIDVLKNDNGDLDVSSVEIVVPEGFMDEHEGATFQKSASQSGKTLVVPDEGTWNVTSDGNITFTVEENVATEPSPISYKVFDKAKSSYLDAGKIIIKKSAVAGVSQVSDENVYVASDSVSTFTNIGLGILALLGTLFGVFAFKREK